MAEDTGVGASAGIRPQNRYRSQSSKLQRARAPRKKILILGLEGEEAAEGQVPNVIRICFEAMKLPWAITVFTFSAAVWTRIGDGALGDFQSVGIPWTSAGCIVVLNIWQPGSLEKLASQGAFYVVGTFFAAVVGVLYIVTNLYLIPRRGRQQPGAAAGEGEEVDDVDVEGAYLPDYGWVLFMFCFWNFVTIWVFEVLKGRLPAHFTRPLHVASLTFNIISYAMLMAFAKITARVDNPAVQTPSEHDFYAEMYTSIWRRPLAVLAGVGATLIFGLLLPNFLPCCLLKRTKVEILRNCKQTVGLTFDVLLLTLQNHAKKHMRSIEARLQMADDQDSSSLDLQGRQQQQLNAVGATGGPEVLAASMVSTDGRTWEHFHDHHGPVSFDIHQPLAPLPYRISEEEMGCAPSRSQSIVFGLPRGTNGIGNYDPLSCSVSGCK
eukprot:g2544.t1